MAQADFSSIDYVHMAAAIQLAQRGLYSTDPNPRVGCIIADGNKVIAEGWHIRAGEGHAEVNALSRARSKAKGATAYVTLEPCSHFGRTPPCAQALIDAGVERVVVSMLDPNPQVAGKGLQLLNEAGIKVESGLLEPQAELLNPGYLKRMRHGRPWVRCKLAMSLDGRTAMASGESQWITSAAAREDVHRLRAQSSAIITGSGTVISDNPSLNARCTEAEQRSEQPLRVVVDSELKVSPQSAVFRQPGTVRIYTLADAAPNRKEALQNVGAEVVMLPARDSRVDLSAMLHELAESQINEVLVEAGAGLAGALLQERLLDKIIIYVAPKLLGDSALGLFKLPGIEAMSQSIELDVEDVRKVGVDWRFTIKPIYGAQ